VCDKAASRFARPVFDCPAACGLVAGAACCLALAALPQSLSRKREREAICLLSPAGREVGREGLAGRRNCSSVFFSPFPWRERGRGKGGVIRMPLARMRAKGGTAAKLLGEVSFTLAKR